MGIQDNPKIYVPIQKAKKGPAIGWIICAFLFFPFFPPLPIGLIVWRVIRSRQNKRYELYRKIEEACEGYDVISLRRLSQRTRADENALLTALRAMQAAGYMDPGVIIDDMGHRLIINPVARQGGEAKPSAEHVVAGVGELIDEIALRAADFARSGMTNFADHMEDRARRKATPPKKEEVHIDPTPEAQAPAKPQIDLKKAPAPEKAPEPDVYEETIRKIRALNDAIADEPVSQKIDRIEAMTASIFGYIKRHPECENDVRRFMNYYLPTTLKLLHNYDLLEEQGVQTPAIQQARRRIEEILDTLVTAFEQQQDRLFTSEARDLSADIDVLQTMLRSDGLGEEQPFKL